MAVALRIKDFSTVQLDNPFGQMMREHFGMFKYVLEAHSGKIVLSLPLPR